jgi:hypothetical protein
VIKIIGDIYLGRKTTSGMKKRAYLLVPLKDLIIGLVWFVPLFSNTVVWRGNRYIIRENSVLYPCPEDGIYAWRYRIGDLIKTKIAWAVK